ncbi:ATP-binding protein [Mycoplasma feriruminatoris]|uniref:AAA+ ATPase domain-containing protein n=1 Tax=Mycoplasma feriruminatoris TaxID=1179777 RepID=A0A654IQE8_9MOLU|nr:hypothetical protein MF5583_00867 [Mycoplasma feriruminatoris]
MKKANIINLIRYHINKEDLAFENEVYLIANDFLKNGDDKLALYIWNLYSKGDQFTTWFEYDGLKWLKWISIEKKPLLFPDEIRNNIVKTANILIEKKANKVLFTGSPGTGKSKAAEQIARMLRSDLLGINFSVVFDDDIKQTQKNIIELFDEINSLPTRNGLIILLDDIDKLVLNKNATKLKQMKKIISIISKYLDSLSREVIIIATTKLYEFLDRDLIKKFDSVINFDNYSDDDLLDIAEILFDNYAKKLNHIGSDTKIVRKIISLYKEIPYPGVLENVIKLSLAFSDPKNEYDCIRKLCRNVTKKDIDLKVLEAKGFTPEEIEILLKEEK